jgi:hypothetical protein
MRSRLRITVVDRKQDWTALLQELIRIPSYFEAELCSCRSTPVTVLIGSTVSE